MADVIIVIMSSPINLETIAALREFDEPGKNDFISEIINAYITDTEVRFKTLWENHQSGNADALGKTAHAIKGSSLNVGADGLASLMKTLEMNGKVGIVSPVERLAEADVLFKEVSAALKAYLT